MASEYLEVYTERGLLPAEIEFEDNNDSRFLQDFDFKKPVDACMKQVIKEIDGSEYYIDQIFKNKFGGYSTLEQVSTGCKTALNIYSQPNICFDTFECGNNADIAILYLPRGIVLMEEVPASIEDRDIRVELHSYKGRKRFKSLSKLLRYWKALEREQRVLEED